MNCNEQQLLDWTLLNKLICGVALYFSLASSASAAFSPTWQTAYDQTSSTTNQLRSVEVSDKPGDNSVYVGLIQTSLKREIYKFSTTGSLPMSAPASPNQTGLTSEQPKAIATDDRGNVFVGDRISGGNDGEIAVYTSGLNNPPVLISNPLVVPKEQFGGLATAHFDGHYYLYASREATKSISGNTVPGEIRRYIVDTATTPTLDTTFGTGGVYTVPGTTPGVPNAGVQTLRGIDVSANGTIYVTNRDSGTVYRISPDLTSVASANVPRAMDVTLFSGMAFVTSYNGSNSLIRVLSMSNLSFIQDINITSLDGGVGNYARGTSEGWGGIDIDPNTGRIWLGDENYNASGITKDRLLVSSPLAAVPEPATVLVLSVVVLMAPLAVRKMKALAA